MAARISGGTPERTLARSSSWRCASQNSVPSRMRRSLRKIGRYSYHGFAFSAGFSMASHNRVLLFGAANPFAHEPLLEPVLIRHLFDERLHVGTMCAYRGGRLR